MTNIDKIKNYFNSKEDNNIGEGSHNDIDCYFLDIACMKSIAFIIEEKKIKVIGGDYIGDKWFDYDEEELQEWEERLNKELLENDIILDEEKKEYVIKQVCKEPLETNIPLEEKNKVEYPVITHKCPTCGYEFEENEEAYECADTGEYFCYENINTIEDIQNTCIGKKLLERGYSLEYIWKIFDSEDDEYREALEQCTMEDMLDKDGNEYIEVFYTYVVND